MVDGEKIRILIVDDIAETRENIRKLLQFEADIDVVATARTGRESIQLTQEVQPHVVLMDINLPDMDGISVTETIRQKNPSTQVVILSVQGDQNYMRKAMLAGARDFLIKPPMPDELVGALRRAGKLAMEESSKTKQVFATIQKNVNQPVIDSNINGKVICVYSPKGGTGCSTIAVNLAVALQNDETRVVIVDANLQFGDVTVFFNEQGKNNILDLSPRVQELDPDIVENVLIKNAMTGVHILASPSRPESAEKVSSDQVPQLLRYLSRLYAYVIVDVNPYLTDVSISIMDTADAIVLVTTQEIPAITKNRLFLDFVTSVNISMEKIVFVMNKFDRRIAISPEKVGENLKQKVVTVIPMDERTVIPAANKGVPFMIESKSQPAAKGIYQLAEILRTKLIQQGVQALE